MWKACCVATGGKKDIILKKLAQYIKTDDITAPQKQSENILFTPWWLAAV